VNATLHTELEINYRSHLEIWKASKYHILNLAPNSNHTKPPCLLEAISKNQYLCVKLNGDFNYNSFWPALYLAVTPPKQSIALLFHKQHKLFFFSHTIYTIKEVENRTENTTRFKTTQIKEFRLSFGLPKVTCQRPNY